MLESFVNRLIPFFLYQLLPFIFILGFCVTIHEFGHFIMAKLFHIPVEKFSIGYGPAIIRKKVGETDFRIAYFPLGGYVKMTGEDEGEIVQRKKEILDSIEQETGQRVIVSNQDSDQDTVKDKPNFYDAPIFARILVIFNGPFFNIVSAFMVFFLIFIVYGVVITPYTRITVDQDSALASMGFQSNDSIVSINGEAVSNWESIWSIIEEAQGSEVQVTVVRDGEFYVINGKLDASMQGISPLVPPVLGTLKKNSPADNAGMHEDDRIIRIDDRPIASWNEMVDIVRESPGTPLQFTWQHADTVQTALIVPEKIYDPEAQDTIGQIGVFMPHGRQYLTIFRALGLAGERTIDVIGYIVDIFRKMFTRQISVRQLGGPIAIFQLVSESAQWGFERLLTFLVIISVNLGLINLVPLPALDGGHIVMGVIEALRRKRFSRKTRLVIQQVGYAILFLLIIFVTFNDITR